MALARTLTSVTLSAALLCTVVGCTSPTSDPQSAANDQTASKAVTSTTSLAGEYRATADRASFDRNDSTHRWDYYELSIVDLGNGQCTYSARTVDIGCGLPCSASEIDDPANQKVHEGGCRIDDGGQTLTLLGTSGADYDQIDLTFHAERVGNRLELTAKHDGVKQTFESIGSAPKARARDFAIAAGVEYVKEGRDNNYVSMLELPPGTHEPSRPQATYRALSTPDAIKASLAKCAFMRQGTYGDHITPAKHEELVSNVSAQLLGVRTAETKYFQVDGATITDELGSPGCVFRIEEGGYRLELESATFD